MNPTLGSGKGFSVPKFGEIVVYEGSDALHQAQADWNDRFDHYLVDPKRPSGKADENSQKVFKISTLGDTAGVVKDMTRLKQFFMAVKGLDAISNLFEKAPVINLLANQLDIRVRNKIGKQLTNKTITPEQAYKNQVKRDKAPPRRVQMPMSMYKMTKVSSNRKST